MYPIVCDNLSTGMNCMIDRLKKVGVNDIHDDGRKILKIKNEIPSIKCIKPWQLSILNYHDDNFNPIFEILRSLWVLSFDDNYIFPHEIVRKLKGDSRRINNFNISKKQIQDIIKTLKNKKKSPVANYEYSENKFEIIAIFRISNDKLQMSLYHNHKKSIFSDETLIFCENMKILHSYISCCLKIQIGAECHFFRNMWMYATTSDILKTHEIPEVKKDRAHNRFVDIYKTHKLKNIVSIYNQNIDHFDYDLKLFFEIYNSEGLEEILKYESWKSLYFKKLVIPVLNLLDAYNKFGPYVAHAHLERIESDDHRHLIETWLNVY